MPEPMSGVTGFDQYGDCVGPNGTASPYWKSVPGFKQDFSGDGCPDVLARHASDTRLRYWKGNCDGGLGAIGTFGLNWDIYAVIFTPGDFTGNGCADVMARASGSLYYWQGDCAGGLGARVQCCAAAGRTTMCCSAPATSTRINASISWGGTRIPATCTIGRAATTARTRGANPAWGPPDR